MGLKLIQVSKSGYWRQEERVISNNGMETQQLTDTTVKPLI